MNPTGPSSSDEELLAKIRRLPPKMAAEVEDIVDFLSQRVGDRRLSRAASRMSEAAFRGVRDNPEDAE